MAEEIGRRIAQQLSSQFARVNMDLVEQQSRSDFAAQTLTSLDRAITLELRGFNQVAPSGFHLTMLSGQKSLIFSFDTTLALTLKVDAGCVKLVLPPLNQTQRTVSPLRTADARITSEFAVTRDETGFRYQKVFPTTSITPILSESEFIEGVIRVACSLPFEPLLTENPLPDA